MTSLYQELKNAGVEITNWQSDLYCPKNAQTIPIVKKYEKEHYISTFKNLNDGLTWYDVAFAYDPYWEKLGK